MARMLKMWMVKKFGTPTKKLKFGNFSTNFPANGPLGKHNAVLTTPAKHFFAQVTKQLKNFGETFI